jgi:ubiquinol-cytochrome c reductase cytochrome b subunit
LAGSFLTRLIGAANGIGVLTFSRFYAVHTLLLPAAMIVLVAAHILLVRRHGITSNAIQPERTQTFYPRQAFRDVLAVFLTFVILFAAAAFLEVPLERLADPTDTSYTPRPEWYFLFLFQLLRVFQGPLEPVATMVLPSAAVLFLFFLPFVSTARFQILNRRALSVGIVLLVFAIWGGLTSAAMLTSPTNRRPAFVPVEAVEWAQIPPEEIAGIGYFRSSGCDSCHNLFAGTPKPGPNLASAELHRPKEWLIQHFNAETTTHLAFTQLNALSLFIANLKPDSAEILQAMPPKFIAGAQTFVVSACGSCHKVNGIGGGVGPPLNGLAGRRNKQWVEEHFVSPKRLSPGSIMPPYRFTPAEEEAIILYLFSLSD